jgi:methionine-R-sulfoxide reductase
MKLFSLLPLFALVFTSGCSPEKSNMPHHENSSAVTATVTVREFGSDGKLGPAVAQPKVVKTDAEWRDRLSAEAFQVARGKGTERPFCGAFYDNHQVGTYNCVCCALPLFRSDAKFESGTGWPSFFQPISKENVSFIEDRSHGMKRTEILCTRCDCHLGHVFEDGPKPTGLRFCLNSVSLNFVPDAPAVKTGGKTDH